MRFDLKPWDRNRPRRKAPVADCVVSRGGKTFGLRAQNGMLFFREEGDAGKTWAIAAPLPPKIEGEIGAYEAFWGKEYGRGNVARCVVALASARQVPVFLRGDGTGWARESWNRDDIPFSHRVSMHFWMEGDDEAVIAELNGVSDQIESALEKLDFPPDTTDDEEIEWACGSPEELEQLVGWICALEGALWADPKAYSVEVMVSAENAFARAHIAEVEIASFGGAVHGTSFIPNRESDVLEFNFYDTLGDAPIPLSNRFFDLMDLALDANTPLGLFWQYTDEGAGRCADAPEAPTFAIQVKAPTREEVESARASLRRSLGTLVPLNELERMLSDDAPRTLPRSEW